MKQKHVDIESFSDPSVIFVNNSHQKNSFNSQEKFLSDSLEKSIFDYVEEKQKDQIFLISISNGKSIIDLILSPDNKFINLFNANIEKKFKKYK